MDRIYADPKINDFYNAINPVLFRVYSELADESGNHIQAKHILGDMDKREKLLRILNSKVGGSDSDLEKWIEMLDSSDATDQRNAIKDFQSIIFNPNISYSPQDIRDSGCAIQGCHSYAQLAQYELEQEGIRSDYIFLVGKVDGMIDKRVHHGVISVEREGIIRLVDPKWHFHPSFFCGREKEREDFESGKELVIYRHKNGTDSKKEYVIAGKDFGKYDLLQKS